jgi:O-antigen ligase
MVAESFVFSALFISVVYHIRKNKVLEFNIESLFVISITLVSLIFLIGSFLNPDFFYRGMRGGEEQRLGGYIMNPNELGMLSNIALGLGLTRTFRKLDLKSILIILINAFVVFETGSRSSVIGLLLMLVFLLFYLGKPRHYLLYGIASVVPAYLLTGKIILKTGFEEVLSMTGRIPFWKALIDESFSLRPILGNGFMRIADSDYFMSFETYSGAMAHNTFMQVLLGLGIIGLILVLIQFFLTLRNAYKHLNSNVFIISIIIPVVVNSMTEFGIYGMSNYGVLFWQFLVIYLVIDWPRIKCSSNNLNLEFK